MFGLILMRRWNFTNRRQSIPQRHQFPTNGVRSPYLSGASGGNGRVVKNFVHKACCKTHEMLSVEVSYNDMYLGRDSICWIKFQQIHDQFQCADRHGTILGFQRFCDCPFEFVWRRFILHPFFTMWK